MIRRVPLAHGGLVYELTEHGRELEPILLALGRWGSGRWVSPGGRLAAGGEPEVWFATGAGIGHPIAGALTPTQAVERDVVTILKGSLKLLERFTELFRIEPG